MLDKRSLDKMLGVHPDLLRVVNRAARDGAPPFRVIEGMRTIERQRELVRRGASKTMNSRHLTGHAVDIVPVDANGNISWDWPLYHPLAKAIKEAARKERVPIEWGGDWKRFRDGPHWQLPWKQYPTAAVPPEAARDAPMTERSSNDLTRSRTVAGGGIAGAGGVAVLINEAVKPLQDAQGAWSTGEVIGILIGVLIVAGAGLALYARWDDAGRPLPWRKD